MDDSTQPQESKQSNTLLVVGLIAVLAVVGGIALMKKQAPKEQAAQTAVSPTAAPSVETSPAVAGAEDSTVKTIEVEGGEYYFKPNAITVKKGDTVKVVFKNVDGFHDFVIDEFNAKTKRIQANQTDTVTFVADKTGTFEYYCSVGKHREMGMKGTLTVE